MFVHLSARHQPWYQDFRASNFPKESVINETSDDTETLDSTKPDRNRDFARVPCLIET